MMSGKDSTGSNSNDPENLIVIQDNDGLNTPLDFMGTVEITKTPTEVASGDNCLVVTISEALCIEDDVTYTIHTSTTLLENFTKSNFKVVRKHEEFVWLHARFEENEYYAGYLIPPCPPEPNFDESRLKICYLRQEEGNIPKDEYKRIKKEIEAEYLASFKKTVAMHEVFLTRLSSHSEFRKSFHMKIFLEYDKNLCAKPKSQSSFFGGFVHSLSGVVGELFFGATTHDVDDFFENEFTFLEEYVSKLKEAAGRTEKMILKHKEVANVHGVLTRFMIEQSIHEKGSLERFLVKSANIFEQMRQIERRVASDQDLKLVDTLRYYQWDSDAAKALIIRRRRCIEACKAANQNLQKARAKNKEIEDAEKVQTTANNKFESISTRGKDELVSFRARRADAFKKSFKELAELELKLAKASYEFLQRSIEELKEIQ